MVSLSGDEDQETRLGVYMARVKWLIVLLCLSVSACEPGAATVSPTAQGTVPAVLPTAVVPDATSGAPTPSGPATQNGIMPTDPNQIKARVETIVNQYLAAMSHQDAQALAKVIDLERLSFKRGRTTYCNSRSPIAGLARTRQVRSQRCKSPRNPMSWPG